MSQAAPSACIYVRSVSDRTSSPKNTRPKPASARPQLFTRSREENFSTNTPARTSAIKTAAASKDCSAAICAVTQLPMLAPRTTEVACPKDITPELTKPMTITTVTEELCTTAVVTAPSPTPAGVFPELRSNSVFRPLPAIRSRLSPSSLKPSRKAPKPARILIAA